MAVLCAFSTRFRPINRQLFLWTWRSSLHVWNTSFIGCEKKLEASNGHLFSHLSYQYRNAQIQSQHMLCSSPAKTETDVKKFNLIYKFPGIRLCKVLSRLKLLQTTLTVTVLPPLYYYCLQGQVPESTAFYFTGIAVFAGVMLYSFGYYFQRIIGMIYINQENTTLKVSHLTFWGRRKDIYLPIADVKPMSETGDRKGEVLLQFKRYSRPDVLYFTKRYGQILDEEKFNLIFGEI
ncbi:transmembrane protein 186 isoform X2 [Pyxicephalus adspersus]